ncbi:GNAT family N-acetyltransferase [Paracoccus salipaludis]|uniref:Aminoglycoside 6'-acetyltransferase n=1 Tax=Paracoccus salipaludis TaxID=2032623 RepID=A0A2A2GGU7_9RHOB|nr:GNAT family N-acetyltransferase [Paracoccus salipaludis]PAU96113.1 aminoglycoside 6'-acetyltransferase [Paracoccus salipaludis]
MRPKRSQPVLPRPRERHHPGCRQARGRPGAGLAGFTGMGLRDHAEGCGPGPVADVDGRYVDADLRGPGIGRDLVRAGEDWARARGLSGIASDALVANEASIAAHRALGFTEAERIVRFRRGLS